MSRFMEIFEAGRARVRVTLCQWCGEEIRSDQPSRDGHHVECLFRAVVGSVAHIERRCSCYVLGSTAGDPEWMSQREAAIAAYYACHVRE